MVTSACYCPTNFGIAVGVGIGIAGGIMRRPSQHFSKPIPTPTPTPMSEQIAHRVLNSYKKVTAQKLRAMKFPCAGIPIDAKFRDQATGAMLQPELCPECVTPLPHWGAALPGFIP
ncbi:hypothetical protein JCM31598_01880 [Desulfonatronum parangueonense]